MLDDEELVGSLEELVDRRAHRALDDPDEVLRVELARRADEQRAAAALVVRRERHELEDPLDVVAEARLGEPLGGAASNEALRAGAGIDPGRLDADDATRAGTGRGRDADQRDHLLGREAGDRRLPADRPARGDAHLGAERLLALDDVWRDPVRKHLDEQALSEHHVVDRLVEELGEARHVDALLVAREIDGALDLGGHHGSPASPDGCGSPCGPP